MRRRRRVQVALLLAVALALAPAASGCTGSSGRPAGPGTSPGSGTSPTGGPAASTAPASRRGGTLAIALLAPRIMDPALAVRFEERMLAGNLFDGLTALAPDGAVRPAVAVSWTSDPTLRHWRFQLHPDARFSNGAPVRAEDFKAAWERLAGLRAKLPPGTVESLLGLVEGFQAFAAGKAPAISGVSAPDPTTVTVELNSPLADLPALLADPRLSPVPSDLVERGPAPFSARPVGNGPFMLSGRSKDLVLVRNARYAGPPPNLDRVRVESVPDELTAWLAFQHGRVRFAPVPPDQLAAASQLAEDPPDGPTLLHGPSLATWSLGFDLRVKPANDPRWRQAISLAIDRTRLATALSGSFAPAETLVPVGVPGASAAPASGPAPAAGTAPASSAAPGPGPGAAQAACPACRHDPARARALFAQVGRAGGGGRAGPAGPAGPVALAVPDTPLDRRIASLIAEDLRKVGVGIKVAALASGGSPPSPGRPPAPLFAATWTAATPRMDAFLINRFTTGAAANLTGFHDPAVDGLLAQARATPDEAARTRLYQQAESAILAQLPVVPLLQQRHAAILAAGVESFDLTPWGNIDLAAVSLPNRSG